MAQSIVAVNERQTEHVAIKMFGGLPLVYGIPDRCDFHDPFTSMVKKVAANMLMRRRQLSAGSSEAVSPRLTVTQWSTSWPSW
jgi:hypothetical protein